MHWLTDRLLTPATVVSRCLLQESAPHTWLIWIRSKKLQAGVMQNKVKAWFAVSPCTISKMRAIDRGISETSCKVGTQRKRHPEKSLSSTCQLSGAVDFLQQICSQVLQDNIADGSLPISIITGCCSCVCRPHVSRAPVLLNEQIVALPTCFVSSDLNHPIHQTIVSGRISWLGMWRTEKNWWEIYYMCN